jgi:hypothetical protein
VGGGGGGNFCNGKRDEDGKEGRSGQRRAETGDREQIKQGERERGGGMNSLRANKIWGIGARDAARKVYTGQKMFIHGGAVCGKEKISRTSGRLGGRGGGWGWQVMLSRLQRKLFEDKTSSKSEHNEGRRWKQIKRAGGGGGMLQEKSTQVKKCSSMGEQFAGEKDQQDIGAAGRARWWMGMASNVVEVAKETV